MDFFKQRFFTTAGGVRKELAGISTLLTGVQDSLATQNATIDEANKASKESNNATQRLLLRVESQRLIVHEAVRPSRENPLQWLKLALEVGTFLVVAAYTALVAFQFVQAKESTDAAKRSADIAAKQLEMSERPWVDADITLNGPLYYNINGGNLQLKYTLRNTGHSPAFNAVIIPQVVFAYGGPDPVLKRNELCNLAAHDYGSGITVFPNTTFVQAVNVGIAKEDIAKATKTTQGYVMAPTLVTCIAYRPTFDDKAIYKTAYIVDVLRHQDREKIWGVAFMPGQEVPVNKLQLRLSFIRPIEAN